MNDINEYKLYKIYFKNEDIPIHEESIIGCYNFFNELILDLLEIDFWKNNKDKIREIEKIEIDHRSMYDSRLTYKEIFYIRNVGVINFKDKKIIFEL